MAKSPISHTNRGVIPFVISDIVRTAILTIFPTISLFMIRWMY
jgi:TRAP-type C4-dicarboxylate transport system permease large subunit